MPPRLTLNFRAVYAPARCPVVEHQERGLVLPNAGPRVRLQRRSAPQSALGLGHSIEAPSPPTGRSQASPLSSVFVTSRRIGGTAGRPPLRWERTQRLGAPRPLLASSIGRLNMAEGYCVKDKKKVEIQNPEKITMKNGKPAVQGTCPTCGGKVFRIGA